jgi:hypothetical protein
MGAILLLSQRVDSLSQNLADLQRTAAEPQALVSQLQLQVSDGIAQQQVIQDKLTQTQETLNAKLELLERKKEAGWQLTDLPAIRYMLTQLQASAQLNPDPARLADFLQHWQQSLSDSGVSNDHALMQALSSERTALRSDVPNWQSEAPAWQSLASQLASVHLETGMTAPLAASETPSDWWQKLSGLVRIRPAGVSDAELAQTLTLRGIWPVQTALALEVIQVGLLTNQPALVNQASTRLSALLIQQTPDLYQAWQSRLQLWQAWQGMPQPQWHYLQNHIQHLTENAS